MHREVGYAPYTEIQSGRAVETASCERQVRSEHELAGATRCASTRLHP